MGIFGFGKKKEAKMPECACNGTCTTSQINIEELKKENLIINAGEKPSIKVLGAGCTSCHALVEYTQYVVKNMGLDIEVEYVTDMEAIMRYGVMSIPALVVNEKVVTTGKVLKSAEIEKLLKNLGF